VILVRRIGLLLALAVVPLVVAVLAFAAYIYSGVRAGGVQPSGTLAGLGVHAPVRIARDARGIPHIKAANERDLFFAEGYVQGSDRLFQIDIYRRLVAGRLSEIFGSAALASDKEARTFDVARAVADQERSLDARGHDDLNAFAEGINAAIRTRPLPPEFRVLGYRPEEWRPRDALLVAFATVVALADGWGDVLTRDDVARTGPPHAVDAFFPITDPLYDAPVTSSKIAPVAPLPPLTVPYPDATPLYGAALPPERAGLGSNDFTAGAALTGTHRALLANDPHLGLHMPGVWYLVDLDAPGFHAAGATLAGVPGVILGHNEHLAWGVTNGTVATTRIYREQFRAAGADEYRADGHWVHAKHRRETFVVRLGRPVVTDYLATRHGFVFEDRGTIRFAAAWTGVHDTRSGFATYVGLDRAANVDQALQALAAYPGPPQNFVLADDTGRAGYTLAGDVWRDPLWARGALDGPTQPPPGDDYVPFGDLPHVVPQRGALAWTANDRMYGAGYPLRLSAAFEPPYRASRISELLHAGKNYDVDAFSTIQADVKSLAERDLARAAASALHRRGTGGDAALADAEARLATFDGRFVEGSQAAVYAWALRRAAGDRLARYHLAGDLGKRYVGQNAGTLLIVLLRALREKPAGWVPHDDYDRFLIDSMRDALGVLRQGDRLGATWGDVGARIAQHPLASFGFGAWNGTRFPGHGDGFSPHVQGPANTQSFRAVWDVGNWEAGGIVIPQGESGQPGSRHYRDGAPVWLAGNLVPLPFGDAAVERERVSSETLAP
jgi:penicillin amidase